MAEQKKETGTVSSLIFLQNHGIFAGGQSLEEIESLYDSLMAKISSQLVRKPDFTALQADASQVEAVKKDLGTLTNEPVLFSWNKEFAHYLQDENHFQPVASSFTPPDHIVYAGFKPLWVGEGKDVISAFKQYEAEHGGVNPKIVCVQNLGGVFSLGEKPMPLFVDTVSIAVYTESFGGPPVYG